MLSSTILPLLLYCPSYLSNWCSASISFRTCLKHSASHLVSLESQLLDYTSAQAIPSSPFTTTFYKHQTQLKRSSAAQLLLQSYSIQGPGQSKPCHLLLQNCCPSQPFLTNPGLLSSALQLAHFKSHMEQDAKAGHQSQPVAKRRAGGKGLSSIYKGNQTCLSSFQV